MKALFKNDREKTAKIRKDMNIYGYGEMITNWPD